jgi:hypothetical protein
VGGSQQRSSTAEGSAPFVIHLGVDGAAGSGNLIGYQTPRGATDQLRIVSARYATGEVLPGPPVVLASGLRIDNVPPVAGAFRLPRQTLASDCCRDNWVGRDFPFASALESGVDGGVGGVVFTIHAGPSELTNEELRELPAVTHGGDLASSSANSSYSAVAWFRDALGNGVVQRLAPSEGNGLSNALGGVFGVEADPLESAISSEEGGAVQGER